MIKFLQIKTLILLLLCCRCYCIAQRIDKKSFTTIISLNESFKMKVEDTYFNTYGEIYILTSNQSIDSTLLALSKNKYISQKTIFDTLKSKFNVYTVVKNKGGEDLSAELIPTKNYTTSYVFDLDNSPKPPQAITSYVMWQRNPAPFKFTKVDKKCDPAKANCTIYIKKL